MTSFFGIPTRQPKEMYNIDVDEISGVDDPANEEDGWMVMKSTTPPAELGTIEALVQGEQQRFQSEEILHRALSGVDLSSAPDDIQRQAAALFTWLQAQGHGDQQPAQKQSSTEQQATSIINRLLRRKPDPQVEEPEEDDEEIIARLLEDALPDFQEKVLKSTSIEMPARVNGILAALQDLREDIEGPYLMLKKDFTDKKRQALSKQGKALPNGSFPIETCGDVRNAVRAIGRAKNRQAAMDHTCKRAKALDCADQLPGDWPCSPNKGNKYESMD